MLSMWGSEALAKIRAGHALDATPEDVAEAEAKRKAAQKIEEEGKGTCSYCKEDIIKNEELNTWESEFLVGYCPESRDRKHHPKITWTKPNE